MKKSLLVILVPFIYQISFSQNTLGFGSSVYYVGSYDLGVGLPITLTTELNKSKAVKICGSLTFAHFFKEGRVVMRDYSTTQNFFGSYTYQEYDLNLKYIPFDIMLEAKRFFAGGTDEGFGFFWGIGISQRFNLGKYTFNKPVYDDFGKLITVVPEKYKVPVNYLVIGFGYKFDMKKCDVVLGYRLCAPVYALFFDSNRKDNSDIRNSIVSLGSTIYLNFVFGGKKHEDSK